MLSEELGLAGYIGLAWSWTVQLESLVVSREIAMPMNLFFTARSDSQSFANIFKKSGSSSVFHCALNLITFWKHAFEHKGIVVKQFCLLTVYQPLTIYVRTITNFLQRNDRCLGLPECWDTSQWMLAHMWLCWYGQGEYVALWKWQDPNGNKISVLLSLSCISFKF